MGMKKKKNPNPNADKGDKKNNRDDGSRLITDERFAKVHSDPRFQKLPKHKSKVAIDSRFSAMFSDKRFAPSSAPLDKRGKAKKKGEEGNSLTRYYRLDGEEEEEKKKNDVKENEESDGGSTDSEAGGDPGVLKPEEDTSEEDLGVLKPKDEISDDDSGSEEEDLDVESDAVSSDTDTDDVAGSEEDDDSEEVENVPVVEKETNRLAIVNMDWNEVKAADLFVVLSSFLPKEGQILSVSVYPSEFGLKRMEEEAIRGPAALFDGEEEDKDKDSDDDDDDDDEMDTAKLRAYEKSRLRYYYAVVVCDSVATADYLYKSCDGVEFERSSNVLDLRFIPDEMEFKHPPRDQATEAPAGYEGLDFHTRALQHSNVHLSWDEDEPHRVKTLNRKFNADQLADMELKEFLASDESESEEDVDEAEDQSERKSRKCDKYRALIQSGDGSEEEEEDEQQEMEVTFNTGLENISKKILERKDPNSETVWDKHLKKRQEKKAHKNRSKYSSDDDSDGIDEAPVKEADDFFEEEPPTKKSKKANISKKKRTEIKSMETEKEEVASLAELELLLADDKQVENKIKGYKIKADKGKRKKGKKEAPAEDKLPTMDLDPRFEPFLKNPLFSLDPTDPRFKRSGLYARQSAQQQKKGGEELLNEELSHINKKSGSTSTSKQGEDEDEHLKSDKTTSRDKHELSMLVKSVKMKSKQVPVASDNGKGDGSSSKKRKHDQSAKRER